MSLNFQIMTFLKPFDTMKTKMQAQKGYENLNMFKTAVKIVRTEGFIGLYR